MLVSCWYSGSYVGRLLFLDVFELVDYDVALVEVGGDSEFAAHGGDESVERADVHVGQGERWPVVSYRLSVVGCESAEIGGICGWRISCWLAVVSSQFEISVNLRRMRAWIPDQVGNDMERGDVAQRRRDAGCEACWGPVSLCASAPRREMVLSCL